MKETVSGSFDEVANFVWNLWSEVGLDEVQPAFAK
jgi:hypothetical protein